MSKFQAIENELYSYLSQNRDAMGDNKIVSDVVNDIISFLTIKRIIEVYDIDLDDQVLFKLLRE